LGLSTGEAAAALLGSEERLEYTLVGDTVNLSQRLQQLADSGETVLSQATMDALAVPVEAKLLPEQLVKGRDTPVRAWRIARLAPPVAAHVNSHGAIPTTGEVSPGASAARRQSAGAGR
jgi:class 3 adenylate cyclase